MKRLSLIFIFVMLAGCYTPPVIREADTSIQQQQARDIADKLDRAAKEQSLREDVRSTITQGSNALRQSADTLAKSDESANKCTERLSECVTQFKAQGAELAEYKDKVGIFGWQIGIKAKWFAIGSIVTFFSIVALLIALYFTGSFAKIVSAIPIR